MYCNFCGMKLSYPAKYCRQCGQKLYGTLENTQPLPVIDDSRLHCINGKKRNWISRFAAVFSKKSPKKRKIIWQVLYDLLMLAVIIGLVYTLATFNSVAEYQRLTGLWGSIWLIYLWWKR